jgi:hypothetical protein
MAAGRWRNEGGKDAIVCDRILEAEQWAIENFSSLKLGDTRRTARVVKVAQAMAADPSASIPKQNKCWSQTKGAYRLFDSQQLSYESVSVAHWESTRQQASDAAVVLLIQDTTELNFTYHPATVGLGRFGSGTQRWESGLGMMLHSVLALEPLEQSGSARVLGVAWGKLWSRRAELTDPRETRAQRRSRVCESARWVEAVRTIGAAPAGHRFVHVADREADIYDLFRICQSLANLSFLIRCTHLQRHATLGHVPDRAAVPAKQRPKQSMADVAAALPLLGGKTLWVEQGRDRRGRWAKLLIRGGAVTIFSPWNHSRTATPLCCWMVHVQEIDTPADRWPVDWVLLSNEPVENLQDATRLTQWYALRWLIEEYHQCLKSGCRVESRQLEHVDRLAPLIGMLAIVATRLLQLKNDSRLTPQRPALACVPTDQLQTLAIMLNVAAEALTLRQFIHETAKLGGFVGRKSDGEPGWQTLWRGWHELQLITYGRTHHRPFGRDVGNGQPLSSEPLRETRSASALFPRGRMKMRIFCFAVRARIGEF